MASHRQEHRGRAGGCEPKVCLEGGRQEKLGQGVKGRSAGFPEPQEPSRPWTLTAGLCCPFLSLWDVGGKQATSPILESASPSWETTLSVSSSSKGQMSMCLCVGRKREDLSSFQESHLFIHSAQGHALGEYVYRHTYVIFSDFLYIRTARSRVQMELYANGCGRRLRLV